MSELPEFIEERDVTWLISSDFSGDRHAIFYKTKDHYFQVEIMPENYPGLGMMWIEDPMEIIKNHYDGWFIRKNNVRFDLPVDEAGYIDFEEG